MPKVIFKNSLGQPVGEYDTIEQIYVSDRSAKKGELFFKKHWFGGKYMSQPIAIDKSILARLVAMGCERLLIRIIGVETLSYLVVFDVMRVWKDGVLICYDKIRQGRNVTHFGTQIAFDVAWGARGGLEQRRLV